MAGAARGPALAADRAVAAAERPAAAAGEVEAAAAGDRLLGGGAGRRRRLGGPGHRLGGEVDHRQAARHPAAHVGAQGVLVDHHAGRALAAAEAVVAGQVDDGVLGRADGDAGLRPVDPHHQVGGAADRIRDRGVGDEVDVGQVAGDEARRPGRGGRGQVVDGAGQVGRAVGGAHLLTGGEVGDVDHRVDVVVVAEGALRRGGDRGHVGAAVGGGHRGELVGRGGEGRLARIAAQVEAAVDRGERDLAGFVEPGQPEAADGAGPAGVLALAAGDRAAEELGDQEGLVVVVAVAVVCDQERARAVDLDVARHLHRLGVDDGDPAFGHLGDEEAGAGRRQGEADRLGADVDRGVHRGRGAELGDADHGAVRPVGDVGGAIVRRDDHRRRLVAGRHPGDPLVIGGLEDGQGVVVRVDHRDQGAVAGQRDAARAGGPAQHRAVAVPVAVSVVVSATDRSTRGRPGDQAGGQRDPTNN